jgi:DNA-binding CsgD family transcriptional regulator
MSEHAVPAPVHAPNRKQRRRLGRLMSRTGMTAMAGVVGLGLTALGATAAQADQVLNGPTVQLNLCPSTPTSAPAYVDNGALLPTGSCTLGNPTQIFITGDSGDNSGPDTYALTIPGAQTTPGTQVSTGLYVGAKDQALLARGDVGRAARQLALLERAASARGLDMGARTLGLQASVARARGQAAQAEAGLRKAVRMLGPDDPLIDRALMYHELGCLLRDRGDRKAAVEQLRTAHQLLAGVGAEPFRQRVAVDLNACGIRSAPRSVAMPLALTERERDVVALVSGGRTNREVAAELYISEKAVEYHLRNVFGKLGITSRRQLRDLPGASRGETGRPSADGRHHSESEASLT